MVMLVLIVARTMTLIVIVFVIKMIITIPNLILMQIAMVSGKQHLNEYFACRWSHAKGHASRLPQKQHETVLLVVQSYKMSVSGRGSVCLMYLHRIYIYTHTGRYLFILTVMHAAQSSFMAKSSGACSDGSV